MTQIADMSGAGSFAPSGIGDVMWHSERQIRAASLRFGIAIPAALIRAIRENGGAWGFTVRAYAPALECVVAARRDKNLKERG